MSLPAPALNRSDGLRSLRTADRSPCAAAASRSLPKCRQQGRAAKCCRNQPASLAVSRSVRNSQRRCDDHSQLRLICQAAELDQAQPAGGVTELEERDQNGADDGYEFPEGMLEQILPATVPSPIFDAAEACEMMMETNHEAARSFCGAFFSSVLGGIVQDPGLMTLPIDDHLVHRGHGVFDTAQIVDGYLYGLHAHFARFMASAERAAIMMPLSTDQMVRTILETAAASNLANGHVRYWLSPGRGGFGLSSRECPFPTFYVVAYSDGQLPLNPVLGWKVKTSPVPVKDPYFATLKSNNYLPNVLNLMDAESEGFDQGIFVDADGNVAEGANMNMAILTVDDILVVRLPLDATPPFENALAGITIQRILHLIPHFKEKGMLQNIAGIEQRHFSVEEAKGAKEVMLTSSSLPVMPIIAWDGKEIASGEAGPVAMALHAMMMRDATPADKMGDHMPVPYGYTTGQDPNAAL